MNRWISTALLASQFEPMGGQMLRIFGYSVGVLLSFCVVANAQKQQSQEPPRGCPFAVAVRQVDDFAENKIFEYSKLQAKTLETMRQASANATKPGISIGQQMSIEDQKKFMDARHASIIIGATILKISQFQRDVHVLADTYQVAQYAALYEVTSDSLGQFDPRRFNFMVLDLARAAQPQPLQRDLLDNGVQCDPEAGLFFEENFNRQQLAKQESRISHLVKLLDDIERLRSLYQVMWLSFDRGFAEFQGVTWNGDTPNIPNLLEPAVRNLPTSGQRMSKTIVPFIDQHMPTQKDFEIRYQAKFNQAVQAEYPTKGK